MEVISWGLIGNLRKLCLNWTTTKYGVFCRQKVQTGLNGNGTPPQQANMGGVWERMIRSVRNILASLMKTHGHMLDDESFRTVIVEAEAIVNSRPLTVDTISDPESPHPLSPANILTMKSMVTRGPPGVFQKADVYCRKRWRRVQHVANEFWLR